jgi:hypothetical protein
MYMFLYFVLVQRTSKFGLRFVSSLFGDWSHPDLDFFF